MDKFLRGYLEALLWLGVLTDGMSIDDIDASAIASAKEDCDDFQKANAADLEATGADDGQLGHDFYLTRNRHGAGFWDRGYGPAGDRLTKAAHVYGDSTAYLGDDDRVYLL